MNFYKKTIKTDNFFTEYWDTNENNNVSDEKRIVLLLSPGDGTGTTFQRLIEKNSFNDVRFISPTFSGRGLSYTTSNYDNSLDEIAEQIYELVKFLNINKLEIYACSFGTMIVDLLLHHDDLYKMINRMLLVFPGEYFSEIKRLVFKIVFYPCKLKSINYVYWKIAKSIFSTLERVNYIKIYKQWTDTLTYQITPAKVDIPTLIYFGNDNIATKQSTVKIKQKYQNSKIISLDYNHPVADSDVQKILEITIKDNFGIK